MLTQAETFETSLHLKSTFGFHLMTCGRVKRKHYPNFGFTRKFALDSIKTDCVLVADPIALVQTETETEWHEKQ